MAYKTIPFEKRIKDNIKNYAPDKLFPVENLTEYFKAFTKACGVEILLTDRHGERLISTGDFSNFNGDVVANPGRKVRVCDRTVGHLYCRFDNVEDSGKVIFDLMLDQLVALLERLGEQTYLFTESSFYIDELEDKEKTQQQIRIHSEKLDPLTGVFNKLYFEKRMGIIDRAEIIPVGVVNININDWKYVNDHFGDEESDRLIRLVANLIRTESKAEYVVGRVDGDVFVTLIPMAEDNEAEEFARRVQAACLASEDAILSPSVACGVIYKSNVEQHLEDLLSDAEYEMFRNKLEIKNAPGYRERLEKRG
ncbi:MAG: GGDEF domain-containing protein [Clostridiales bacterium]|nr:GGDEF domain-containing protein [Clostridiales bacterium]